jgi:hypothetical protein
LGWLEYTKRELCVKGILAQHLGFVLGAFQRGFGDFRDKRPTKQETIYYCLKCSIEGRNSEITLSGSTSGVSGEESALAVKMNLLPTSLYCKITRVPNDFWLNYAKKAEPFLGLLWIFDKR